MVADPGTKIGRNASLPLLNLQPCTYACSLSEHGREPDSARGVNTWPMETGNRTICTHALNHEPQSFHCPASPYEGLWRGSVCIHDKGPRLSPVNCSSYILQHSGKLALVRYGGVPLWGPYYKGILPFGGSHVRGALRLQTPIYSGYQAGSSRRGNVADGVSAEAATRSATSWLSASDLRRRESATLRVLPLNLWDYEVPVGSREMGSTYFNILGSSDLILFILLPN